MPSTYRRKCGLSSCTAEKKAGDTRVIMLVIFSTGVEAMVHATVYAPSGACPNLRPATRKSEFE